MTKRRGFVALISMLIIAAVAASIIVSLLLRSVGDSQMTVTTDLAQRAELAASACAELGIQKLAQSSSYGGNVTLTLDSGDTCTIGVPGGVGNNNRSLVTTSTILNVTRTINVQILHLRPQTQISSWQDVIN